MAGRVKNKNTFIEIDYDPPGAEWLCTEMHNILIKNFDVLTGRTRVRNFINHYRWFLSRLCVLLRFLKVVGYHICGIPIVGL